FFILQAHYRSTVDFSNEALQASEKGLSKIVETYNRLMRLQPSDKTTVDVAGLRQRCEEAMCDDLNTPIVISHLFEAAKAVNTVADGKGTISKADLDELKDVFKTFVCDILGLQIESAGSGSSDAYKKAIDLLLSIRQQAKQNKDWATSDRIRNELAAIGFNVKDTKDGFEWELAND
ncbi:MAG: cysteine--tRNA ligase, partial [Salinivirgaceae bacterium]|nr:cysteine--tRNA ligase [Salinivirgaceae bacterium]